MIFKTHFKIYFTLFLHTVLCSLPQGEGWGGVFAQTYPVQLSTSLIPPYSGYLPDYADPSSEKLKVILQFNDFTVAQYNVRLKIEIKGNGFTLTTKQFYNPPPLQIEPGVPFMLSGADIAPYLNSNNLDFVGINQSQYEQRMALPEGYYSICVKAYDYYNNGNVQVSNEACAQAWFTLSDPPFLNLPLCNAAVTPQSPQNILFQWTPMNLGSPNSALNTEYLFELWECRPDTNANPNQIAQSTPPIYSTTTQQTQLNYGLTEPPLNLYMKYVWRVKAQDVSGRDLFKNQGYSQICTFNYGSVAGLLGNALSLNLTAQGITHRLGKCSWNTQSLYTSYKLQVRKKGTTNWFDYNTNQSSEKITNLEPNTEYEAQVQGIGNGITSAWSNIASFTTNNEPNYNCNDQTQLADPLQAQPLPISKAIAGLIIQSGQFEVVATQLLPTGAPGWYSGKGYAKIFGALPLAVQWQNIYIDDNNRHQQGVIEALTKGVDNWLQQWDVNQATDNAGYVQGTITGFTVTPNGQYCYTLQGGNSEPICANTPTGVNVFVVRDDNGNQYTVQLIPPPPTVTGPTNYLQTSTDELAACDSLQLNFIASPNQAFGFDVKEYAANIPSYECIKLSNGTNYFVPYKSIGEAQTDEVYAEVAINNFKAANLSFKTQAGTAITSASITTTKFKLTGINANAGCVYAYYNNKKIAKLNIVSLKPITKKLVIVPVNNSSLTLPSGGLGRAFNQANVSWSVTTAANFTFNIGDDGLEAADATLLAKYSAEMRALRDAYKQATPNYDKDAYYIFVVPNFSNAQLKGYMVRGRALGFVTANANAKEVAHELAHGAFGLEHTFPKIEQSSTNNLLDYGSGTQLTKTQWDEMRNVALLPRWSDDEEDGALVDKNCHYALTPNGQFIDDFYALDGNIKLQGNKVIRYIHLDDYYISSIAYNNEVYDWAPTEQLFISNTGKKIKTEASVKTNNDKVNIFKSFGDGCNYESLVINWLDSDKNSSNIKALIQSKIDASKAWQRDLFVDTKSEKCGLINSGIPSNCPPLPNDLTTLTIDFLINNFFAYRSPACLTPVPLVKRKELIKLMLNNWLVTNCVQSVASDVVIGNCYEPLIYNLILSTPIAHEKIILDWFVSEKLLVPLLNKTQFQTFDEVVKTLAKWQLKYYPLSGKDAIAGALENSLKRINFEANKVTGSITLNGITLTREVSGLCSNCTPIPEISITVSNPLSYVVVYFKQDVLNFKAGTTVKLPALVALYIFNKDRRDLYISSSKILLDISLCAIGVGEIEAAYTAYRSARTAYAAYVGIKALSDMGMSIADVVINDVLAQSWQNTPEGKARLERWNQINLYYALGSLSASAIDNAIQKLGSSYKSLDDANEFDAMASELDGITNSASALVNSLNPQLRKIHNNLVSGGVQIFEQGNVIKYVTNNGNEFARIENGLFSVTMPKGSRPNPNTYFNQKYIDDHLSIFSGGVTKITSYNPTGAVGPPGGTFVLPKSLADDLIQQAGGDVHKLEDLLGLHRGDLGATPFRIDVNNPSGLRMPTGNEPGANEFWIPGGKTSGGIMEATVDQIQPGTYTPQSVF